MKRATRQHLPSNPLPFLELEVDEPEAEEEVITQAMLAALLGGTSWRRGDQMCHLAE